MHWHVLPEEKRKWWVLFAMTTSISMIFIDVTVLPVALPTLDRELGLSALSLQWIVNAYTLALTVLVLAGGRLGDMWGLRRSFCFGIGLFALASAFCGISQTASGIIVSRVLQGAGGAFMLPATQGIIVATFPPHQRGKAIGVYVSVGSIFLALGPLIGGALTQYLSWRYVFWINLPIATTGLALTLLTVPPFPKKSEHFDLFGFLTVGMGASALIVGIMNGQGWGWLSPLTLFLIAFGTGLIFFLVRAERQVSHPLIDLDLLKKRSFVGGASTMFLNQLIIMVTVFWAIYFQNVLNYSPSAAGVITFIANLPVLFMAPLAGFLVDRLGPRFPVACGFTLTSFSLLWFLFAPTTQNLHVLLPILIIFGCGIPLIFTPSYVSIMNDVPPEKRGAASGMLNALRQFSATLGMALFGTLFYEWHRVRFAHALAVNPASDQLDPSQYEGLLAHAPAAMLAVKELTDEASVYVQTSMVNSFVASFELINFIAAALAIGGLVTAIRILKNSPFSHPHQ